MIKNKKAVKYYTYVFQIISDNQWQKLWQKLLFEEFCVSTPFSLFTMSRNNEQNLRQVKLRFDKIVLGRRGILKHNF